MKMQFWVFITATAKSKKCHIYLASSDHQYLILGFSNSLAVQEVSFSITSYKKLYRKQPVEVLITEHIFLNQT